MKRLFWDHIKICILLAMLALAALPAPAAGAPLPQADDPLAHQHLSAGLDYFSKRDYTAALQEFEQALSLYRAAKYLPGEAAALHNLGYTHLLGTGDYAAAVQDLEQALAIYQAANDHRNEANVLLILGYAHRSAGDYAAAIQVSEQALALYEALKDQMGQANALDSLGQAELTSRQPDSALTRFEAALPLYQVLGQPAMVQRVQLGAAMALTQIAAAQAGAARYPEAQSSLLRAIELCRAAEFAPCQVSAVNDLGEVYDKLGRYTDALAQHKLAQEMCAAAGGCGQQEANILANTGRDYFNLGDYDKALDTLQQALSAAREIPDQNLEGIILNSLGGAYTNLARYDEALAQYQAAQGVFQAIGFPEGLEATHINIGELFRRTGRSQEALREYQAARALAAEIPDLEGEATILGNIGSVYVDLGQYEEAIRDSEATLEIWQRLGSLDGQAVAHNTLGVIMTYLGQFEAAEQHYQAAADLRVQAGNPHGIAVTASNRADFYFQLSRYDKALQEATKARDQAHSINAPALEAIALDNMGAAQAKLGENEAALSSHQAALAIRQSIGDRPGEAASRANLAAMYGDQKRYPEALAQYEMALDIFQETGQVENQAQALANTGRVYGQQGNLAEAIRSYRAAVDLSESLQGKIKVEELATSFAAGHAWMYSGLIDALAVTGEPETAFDYAERARARAFLDQLGNQQVDFRRGAQPELINQEQELRQRVIGLQSALDTERAKPLDQQTSLDKLGSDLTQARKDYQELLTRLKLESPEYASLVSVNTLRLKEVQSQVLDQDTTLIEYYVLDDKTLAWVMDQEGSELVTLQIGELRNQVEFLRNVISGREHDPQAAAALYNALFAPLKPHIRHPNLVIVPHGVLHYLPFAALWDAEHGRYLLEDYALTYAPSASALKFILDKRSPAQERLLAMGNPDSSLPYAEAEAEAVAKLYGTAPLLKQDAVESQVYAQAGQIDLLHLAAHGEYNPYNPLYSRIELAPDEAQDGSLEVHEVFGLDLSGANLVVLSACKTALGKQSDGDELVGLTRAFLYAGTPAVVTTLWSVDDAASEALMERFYGHLREGLTNAEALRAAQLEVLAEEGWSEPWYWAAFSLTGDYRGSGVPGMVIANTPELTQAVSAVETPAGVSAVEPSPAPNAGRGLCASAVLPLGLALVFGAVRPRVRRRAAP
jgi:CHAT domain-containing protein/Tfp pilus assembly protein PilF/predicted negative regulator of RcsB-dependent stress response